jgi:hypothetical protein
MYPDFDDLLSSFHAHGVEKDFANLERQAAKLAAGRLRDLADFEDLREAAGDICK